MALTTIQSNNKLIKFTKEINREFVRANLFSPYMSEDINAVIRIKNELKAGGETMNIPIRQAVESRRRWLRDTGWFGRNHRQLRSAD